jgi:hypothetical protein
MQLMAQRLGLAKEIDEKLHLLRVHLPYLESDHVLNLAYNVLAGRTSIEDLELLRNSEGYLDSLGAQRIPDPTTAGDFCRRFGVDYIDRFHWGASRGRSPSGILSALMAQAISIIIDYHR